MFVQMFDTAQICVQIRIYNRKVSNTDKSIFFKYTQIESCICHMRCGGVKGHVILAVLIHEKCHTPIRIIFFIIFAPGVSDGTSFYHSTLTNHTITL